MVYTKNNHRGDKSLIILRGVSSSGKTSFSKLLKSLNVECVEVSADDYFYSNYDGSNPDGNYKFNPEKLGSAHGECRRKFQKAVDSGAKCVIVSNTNVEKSHWEFYEEYGKEKGYRVFFIVLEKRHGGMNEHNLDESTLIRQENKLRNSLKLR